ncbi:MAG: PAS domain S-box protein [Helicobacteraceae bacterium]|nr:PAS domain S-box protein [Helicobacteraceae bacterium]
MRKVLLVDDSSLIQKIIAMLFAQSNELELVIASSYNEASDILDSGEKFFVAVVCIVLPDALNGQMVDLSISYKIPTLVLTSSLGEDIRDKMARKPIIDYVSKNTQNDINYAVELIHTLLYFENKKVLLVTDNRTDKTMISALFTQLLLKPIHVESTAIAIDLLKSEKDIDIIATSYKMSEPEGLKLIQYIRGKYTRDQKMIFAFTSKDESSLSALFIKYGTNEIITKPILKEEFNARVFKELDFRKTIEEVKSINKTIEQYVITSTTDVNGIIRQVSDAFSEVSGYTKSELIGQPQNIVRHPDMPSEIFKELWETIQSGKKWSGTVKNRKKDGGYYWVNAHIEPIFNSEKIVTGYRAVRQDITAAKEVEEQSKLLLEAKQKITDSIKFSSLIQHALLPMDETISKYLSDFFVLWEPKDIVGGDIYQFLDREDDCLIFVIDCTGHGVPGAFMTMVTKTVIQSIVDDSNFDNPALILQLLSKNIKKTLKQENPNSKNDAGFDGGILHYNKKSKKIKYAGAKTPLFYIQNGELKSFKGDRESIGYKKSNTDFEFTNFEIVADCDSYFYLTTDGFIDQNGGDEGFPLGKKKIQKLIEQNYTKSFEEQKEIFHKFLLDYQSDYERDDDVTFFAFSLSEESKENVSHFFKYNGDLNQDKLGEIEDELENNHQTVFHKSKKKEKLYTVLYELGQNIIKYGVQNVEENLCLSPLIELYHNDENDEFCIVSKNLVTNNDAKIIKTRIEEANSVDKKDIKERYKKLRKSKKYLHSNGAGLGFFEFAKRSSQKIRYNFDQIDENISYYSIVITI